MITFQLNTLSEEQDSKYRKYFTKICNLIESKHTSKLSRCVEVSFIDDKRMQCLNKKYRNINKSTDVLSFSVNEKQLLGEIFISYEYAVEESKRCNISLLYEICLLFCHGLLHLLGYDHETIIKEKEMFSLQENIVNNALKTIRINNKQNSKKR